MKKRFLSIIFSVLIATSMITTACGAAAEAETNSTETDSVGSVSENTEVSNQEEDAVPEEDNTSTETETTESIEEHAPYTAADVTDELISVIYDSIKESIITNYIIPNNMEAADFSWPPFGAYDWNYLYESFRFYSTYRFFDMEFKAPDTSMYTKSPTKDLLDAAFTGIINFLESSEPYEQDFFDALYNKFSENHSLIPENVVITDEDIAATKAGTEVETMTDIGAETTTEVEDSTGELSTK